MSYAPGGGGGRQHNGGGNRGGGYRGGGRGGRDSGRGRSSGGRGRGAANPSNTFGLLSLCRDFTSSGGQCPRGTTCHYKHVVQLHATILAATKPPIQTPTPQKSHYNNPKGGAPNVAAVSSIAIWEQPGQGFKIFTSSHDGYWRLWNTAGGQFQQEFENHMNGIVHKCLVSYDQMYLFCGFEAMCRAIPAANVTVGMVHGWNLQQPSQPPLELQIQPSSTSSGASTPTIANGMVASGSSSASLPFAHNMTVTALHMAQPSSAATNADTIQIATGSRDGSIRLWSYRNGAFVLVRSLPGHAREVTGLVILSSQNLLWSSGMDHCIRIWNMMTGDCQHCITGPSMDPPNAMLQPQTPPNSGVGHAMPITALIPYVSPAGTFILSASLDQTVKVWNAVTGGCVASESHNEGIVCMTIARDLGNNELLLLGMESGSIQCRNIQPTATIAAFQLLFTLSLYHTGVGHEGAVKCITAGPSGTFYSGGVDGKMLVMSFSGDLGLNG
jgi:WD40 repeat protein